MWAATVKIIRQLDTQKGAGGRHTVLKDILPCPLALRREIDPLQSDEALVWLMPLTVIVTPGSGTRAVGREGHPAAPWTRASSGSTQPLFFSFHAPSPCSLSGCHDKSLYSSGLRSLRYQTNRPQTPCWNEYNNGLQKIAQGTQTQEEKWGCVCVLSAGGSGEQTHVPQWGRCSSSLLWLRWQQGLSDWYWYVSLQGVSGALFKTARRPCVCVVIDGWLRERSGCLLT